MFEVGFHVTTGYFEVSGCICNVTKRLFIKFVLEVGKLLFLLMSATNTKYDLALNHDNAEQLA